MRLVNLTQHNIPVIVREDGCIINAFNNKILFPASTSDRIYLYRHTGATYDGRLRLGTVRKMAFPDYQPNMGRPKGTRNKKATNNTLEQRLDALTTRVEHLETAITRILDHPD